MKIISLEYIKDHSRIEYDCEDAILEMYGDSAEETLAQLLNRGKTVDDMVADLTEVYGNIPAPLILAANMLVDVSYQYRSPITPGNLSLVPYTFDVLVKPYMKL